jgi:hypothetical protein
MQSSRILNHFGSIRNASPPAPATPKSSLPYSRHIIPVSVCSSDSHSKKPGVAKLIRSSLTFGQTQGTKESDRRERCSQPYSSTWRQVLRHRQDQSFRQSSSTHLFGPPRRPHFRQVSSFGVAHHRNPREWPDKERTTGDF